MFEVTWRCSSHDGTKFLQLLGVLSDPIWHSISCPMRTQTERCHVLFVAMCLVLHRDFDKDRPAEPWLLKRETTHVKAHEAVRIPLVLDGCTYRHQCLECLWRWCRSKQVESVVLLDFLANEARPAPCRRACMHQGISCGNHFASVGLRLPGAQDCKHPGSKAVHTQCSLFLRHSMVQLVVTDIIIKINVIV